MSPDGQQPPADPGPLFGPGNMAPPQAPELPIESTGSLPGADAAAGPFARSRSVRTLFLFGVLLTAGAAAIVLIVASLLPGDAGPPSTRSGPEPWAAWAPASDDSRSIPQQIAAHVAPRYRLDQGTQAVLVSGGPLTVGSLPLTVAVKAPAALGGATTLLENKKSLLYRFCGLGTSCAMIGQRSVERHLLLRREALELALYSFHDTHTDQVVVFMPPRAGATAGQSGNALFFERSSLSQQLHQRLDSTLTDDVPLPAAIAHSADRLIVENTTRPAYFDFRLQQGDQGGRTYLVLAPLAGRQFTVPAPQSGTPA